MSNISSKLIKALRLCPDSYAITAVVFECDDDGNMDNAIYERWLDNIIEHGVRLNTIYNELIYRIETGDYPTEQELDALRIYDIQTGMNRKLDAERLMRFAKFKQKVKDSKNA